MANQTAQATAKAQETSAPARKGLLYDPAAWSAMVNQMAQRM